MRVFALCCCVLPLLVSIGCAGAGSPRPRPFPDAPEGSPAAAVRQFAQRIAATALDLVGTPYVYGGSDADGVDCSGLVQLVFARQGVSVPRVVADLAAHGDPIARRRIGPGDLLFFRIDTRKPTHVAIALDADRFVHAPTSSGVVRIERLESRYWSRRLVSARRVSAPY